MLDDILFSHILLIYHMIGKHKLQKHLTTVALCYMHNQEIIHQDIKHANILTHNIMHVVKLRLEPRSNKAYFKLVHNMWYSNNASLHDSSMLTAFEKRKVPSDNYVAFRSLM